MSSTGTMLHLGVNLRAVLDSARSTGYTKNATLKKTFVFEVWKQDQNFLSLAPEFGIGQNKKQVIRILDIYCTKY